MLSVRAPDTYKDMYLVLLCFTVARSPSSPSFPDQPSFLQQRHILRTNRSVSVGAGVSMTGLFYRILFGDTTPSTPYRLVSFHHRSLWPHCPWEPSTLIL